MNLIAGFEVSHLRSEASLNLKNYELTSSATPSGSNRRSNMANSMKYMFSAENNSHSWAKTPRIMSEKEGRVEPMFVLDPIGPPSPSCSLLAERFKLGSTDWQTHVPEEQLVSLFLSPATFYKRLKPDVISEMHLVPGEVIFSRRHEWESARWNETINILSVRIADSALKSAARDYSSNERTEIVSTSQVNDERLTGLLYTLEAERARGYPTGRLFLDSIEAAIAALLVSSYGTYLSKPRLVKGGLAPQRLRRVLEFMHANVDKQVTLESLATCAGLSASHFSHQFRASTNMTPHQYMLRIRMDRCKELLRSQNMSMLEIALETGFQNQQHFSTVFRRVVGTSPSDYRREL